MIDLMEEKIMKDEWETWKAWVKEFEKTTGLKLNDPKFNRMVGLIEKWGYSLMKLRNYQVTTKGKGYLGNYETGASFKHYLEEGK